MHTHTDTTRYYLALYTVLVVHAIRNCVARMVAESDPLHDLWYNGIDQVGQGSLDTAAHPLGEVLAAGHGATMGNGDLQWTEEGELATVSHSLEAYECIDSDGDYRNRYFSSSEGMTDTVEAATAPVVADKPTDEEMQAAREERDAVSWEAWAAAASTGATELEADYAAATAARDFEMPEATLYDSHWANIKDGHSDEQSVHEQENKATDALLKRAAEGKLRAPAMTAQFGDMAHYMAFRRDRAYRLIRLARITGIKGRKALRNGDGAGVRAAHDMLDKLVRVTGARYGKAINGIVTKGKRSGTPEQEWDWFALYLTREQWSAIKAAVNAQRNRLHTLYRARQADTRAAA